MIVYASAAYYIINGGVLTKLTCSGLLFRVRSNSLNASVSVSEHLHHISMTPSEENLKTDPQPIYMIEQQQYSRPSGPWSHTMSGSLS
jgi:hypothetical protein